MKLYISTTNTIKRSLNRNIVAYHPFYIIPDEDETFGQLKGMVEVGDMWDIEKIRNEVSYITGVKELFLGKNKELQGLISQMNVNLKETLSFYDKAIKMLEDANKLLSDAQTLSKKTDKKLERVEALSVDRKELVKEVEEAVDGIRTTAVGAVVEIANNALNKYNCLLQDMDTTFKSFNQKVNALHNNIIDKQTESVNACKASETKARQWASESFGTQVEDGKYSALHYATLGKFKEGK